MQAEEAKRLSIDMDKCCKKIVDCLVDGLYGEKYRSRIEKVINNINFLIVGNNQEFIDVLQSEELSGIIENAEEKLKVFQQAETLREQQQQEVEENFEKLCTECAQKMHNYCQENGYSTGMISPTVLHIDFKSCDTRTGIVNIKNTIASTLRMHGCRLSYYSDNHEKEATIDKTELWQIVENMDILSKAKERKVKIEQSYEQNQVMTLINNEFVKQQDLIDEKDVLKTCETMPWGTAACAGSSLNKNGEVLHFVWIPIKFALDAVLIHEIIHILETIIYAIDVENNTFKEIVGFQNRKMVKGEPIFDSEEEKELDEIFEALNEAITDYFATKVYKYMKKNNIKLINDEEFLSSYSACFPYCGDLMELMFDDLLKYRITKNSKKFFKMFGKENMREMAKSFYYFMYETKFCPEQDLEYLNKEFNTNYDSIESVVDNLDKFGETEYPLVVNLRKIEELKHHYLTIKNQLGEQNFGEDGDDIFGV